MGEAQCRPKSLVHRLSSPWFFRRQHSTRRTTQFPSIPPPLPEIHSSLFLLCRDLCSTITFIAIGKVDGSPLAAPGPSPAKLLFSLGALLGGHLSGSGSSRPARQSQRGCRTTLYKPERSAVLLVCRLSVSFTQRTILPGRTLSLTFSTSPRRLLSLLFFTLPTRHDMNLPCSRLTDMRTVRFPQKNCSSTRILPSH